MNSRKDINALRRSLREVNDRVITLEKLMTDSYILLQNIQAAIPHEDKLLSERQKFVHILARRSPYVYTSEARFLVTERYIPWKVSPHRREFSVEKVSNISFRFLFIYMIL